MLRLRTCLKLVILKKVQLKNADHDGHDFGPHPGKLSREGETRTPGVSGKKPWNRAETLPQCVRVSTRQLCQEEKKKLTFVKCLSLTLLQALNCRERILRLTCQPMTTKLLTLPSPVPHIPVRDAATLTEECFLEKYCQHQGR